MRYTNNSGGGIGNPEEIFDFLMFHEFDENGNPQTPDLLLTVEGDLILTGIF